MTESDLKIIEGLRDLIRNLNDGLKLVNSRVDLMRDTLAMQDHQIQRLEDKAAESEKNLPVT